MALMMQLGLLLLPLAAASSAPPAKPPHLWMILQDDLVCAPFFARAVPGGWHGGSLGDELILR